VSLLDEQVVCFNHGVRTGDWTRMLELFCEDADLVFTGIPVGPFHGREAIRRAYTEQPPDDEVVLLRRIGEDAAEYAWARDPSRAAGELYLVARDGEIAWMRIDYETHP
jgi:steroid delta-isomerase